MKMRAVEIIADDSVAAAGETKNGEFPSDFAVTAIALEQVGANVTDEATLAEILAGFGDVEISTRNGAPISWDVDDLFYFNRDILGHQPYISKSVGAGADNDIRKSTVIIPLNPKGIWNSEFGLTPESKGKIKWVLGSDTVSGMDGRNVTVTALGIEGVRPQAFMSAFKDNFTAVLGDNFRDIQADRVLGMMGMFLFATTGPEDLTSTDAQGAKHLGYGVSKSLKMKVKTSFLQQYQAIEYVKVGDTAGTTAPNSDYAQLLLGMKKGEYVPYVDKMQGYVDAGVAEAMRMYPLLAVRNE